MIRKGSLLLATIGALGCCQPCAAAGGKALTFTVENDVLTGSDDAYTNGLGTTWVSTDLDSYDEHSLVRRWGRLWSFLPFVSDKGYKTYASWSLVQEMHTPSDISLADPPRTDQPYAGLLYVDSVGMYGEIGWNLVDAFGGNTLREGLTAASSVGVGPVSGWSVSLFGGLSGHAVARYLPLDGTVFSDSRSVDTKPFVGGATVGASVRHGRLALSLAATCSTEAFEGQEKGAEFGTLSLVWYP